MGFFQNLRAIAVLALVPVLTLMTSFAALFCAVFFRWDARAIQVLPRTWARIILKASGVRVRVEGADKLDPDGTYIYAANHQSQFDIFAMQGYFGFDFRWLAKKELFNFPVFGTAMRYGGYISIDRSHGRKALKSLDLAARRIAEGTSVVIFPEGTRSEDGRLKPFKPGAMVLAIKSKIPLVPVAIIGTRKILPKGKLLPKPGEVVIRVGAPVPTEMYHLKQKQELGERVRGAVQELMADSSSSAEKKEA